MKKKVLEVTYLSLDRNFIKESNWFSGNTLSIFGSSERNQSDRNFTDSLFKDPNLSDQSAKWIHKMGKKTYVRFSMGISTGVSMFNWNFKFFICGIHIQIINIDISNMWSPGIWSVREGSL